MEEWLTPLLDAGEMRTVDRWAIEERGVPSLELMEAAGGALAEAAGQLAGEGPARVVCGKGNNGGDGLVAARALAQTGFEVEALLLAPPDQLSDDARANAERFPAARPVEAAELASALEGSGVVVDAILGTGFDGAPRDPAAAAIEAINGCPAKVVAADVASGVNSSSGEIEGDAVQADLTVTFHAPKLGHWIAPGKWHTGELRVAEIGIPSGAPAAARAGLIDQAVLRELPTRGSHSTKFSSGQVVVAGGSRGLTGAVCLSASAAIRAGAGYATVAVPRELEQIFEVKLTEVMSVACPSQEGRLRPAASELILSTAERAGAVVFGPGLGKGQDQVRLARLLAPEFQSPLVIDADGLNAIAGDLDLLAERPAPTVLTPHAGELGRLLEISSEQVSTSRLACAQRAATESGAIVVLKGDDTVVTDGERVAVNGLASPGLATAGTGDVLSGLTAALISRGLEPFAAACAAVLAHARAGREAASRLGAESVIATDVIESIPAGLRT